MVLCVVGKHCWKPGVLLTVIPCCVGSEYWSVDWLNYQLVPFRYYFSLLNNCQDWAYLIMVELSSLFNYFFSCRDCWEWCRSLHYTPVSLFFILHPCNCSLCLPLFSCSFPCHIFFFLSCSLTLSISLSLSLSRSVYTEFQCSFSQVVFTYKIRSFCV